MAVAQPLKVRIAAVVRQWSGYLRWKERRPLGPVVLVYHGVVEQLTSDSLDAYSIDWRTLRSHVRRFKRKGKVVPVGVLVEALTQGRLPDPRWVVLTFDDALQSQTHLCADLMSSENVPWAISVPAGLVGTTRSVWTYEARFILTKLWTQPAIVSPSDRSKLLPMGANRAATTSQIMRELLQSTSDRDRVAYIEELKAVVGESTLSDAIHSDGRFVMSAWSDIARLESSQVTVMSHGWFHRPHTATLTHAEFQEEVVSSKREIAARLGRDPEGFVFPNGQQQNSSR